MNTVFTSSADPSIGSMSASSNRYNGMIRISLVKRIRNMLFSLFDYMSMTAPHLRVVHTVMSAWRIVQIFGASLCCAYTDFWVPESTLNSTINILSIAFHIFPTSIRAAAGVYFLYGYTIFNVLLFVVIITSAYFYTTRAELPHWLVTGIYFVFSTLCYLLQPIFGMFLGRLIGNFFKYPDEYIVPVHIISAIVSILSLIIFLIIYSKCYSVTVTFRPDSLITVYPINQTFLLIIGFVTSLLPAIACRVDVLPRFILSIMNSLVYGVSFFLLFYKGGFVNMLHTKLYAASTLSGMILMLVVSIQDFIGQTGSEILLFIVIAIWIVVFVIISFIFNRINMSYMRILDLIEEDEEMFSDLIKNDLKFASVAISGIRLAHPICVNYTFFKMAIKAFPKSITVWIVYAKFVAIYPEETQQLEFIFQGIVQNKIKGSFAKHIMQQITAVIKQREQNLIPELKKKLNNIGKHVSACKAKIRYIWELVLQGNISELENVISRAHSSVQRTMTEYQELLGKFPNNRFVARAYTRYLRDVVADHQKCQEWAQKCAQLQRGIQVVPDNAYELGILAFPALPKETSKMISNFNNNNCTEDTLTQEVDVEEEHLAADQELRLSLKDNINSLHIPAYIHVRCLHICSLVLLFIVPLIAIIIATPIYMDDVSSVIPHLYTLTKMRAVLFQGMFVLVHYINENINWSYPKDHKNAGKHFLPFPTYDDFFSSRVTEEETCGPAWGGSFDSKVQLDFISETISNLLSSIIPMKTYKIGNERMNEVRTVLFDAVQPYTHIHDSIYLENWTNMTDNPNDFYTEETHELASLTTIMSNYMTNFKDAAELKEVPWDSYNKYYMGSTLNNLENATGFVTDAVYLMLDYITSLNNSLQFIIMIARIVLIIAIILWYLFVSIYSMRQFNNNKIMIYKCLTTLQKSVVFKVTETFRILHKEDDEEMRSTRSKDEEVSRQEENLLKLFSSSVDSGNTLSIDNVSSILSCIACIILHIVFSVFMCAKYSEISDQIDRTGPHIEHGQVSFAFDLETVVLLHLLPGSVYPSRNFNIYGFQTDTILYYINYWQTKAQQEFTKLKYGDPDNHLKSFAAVGVDINFQAGIPSYCDNETIPINSHDLYDCMSSEIAISYVEMIVNRLVNIYTSRDEIYGGNEEDLTNLYHCMQHHIFDRFYYNLFLSMTNKVVESVEKDLPLIDEIGIIICIIAIVIEIINMIAIQMSENNLRYALSLLLMCPAKMVLSNSHILNVLGGNFHNKTLDQTTRGSDFYDGLVEEMPDSVIIITAGGIINSANKATTSLFNKTKEELVGNRIDLIGNLFKEGNPFQKYFDGNIQNISNSDKAANKETNIEMKLSFDKDDSVVHVLMNLVMLPEGIFVSCRDITQQVMYDKLIQDEKLRSDSLLASILPPRLVSRVASGEKNISFAVQTATVVFIDIVSFTPWCGSTPADKVMKTLNLLFKYFDSSTASHSTMTKCKCIGDCYMAAGGIFADVNQPAVHAKDVVEFGLEALDNIVRLNKEINESLQIRVGINTGGPLVAGVLGTEKPTFEILGPTINMAQQMEHHGVPMKVHISRSVYELIYGSNFKIQERGQIEIKNGQVVTYLVSRE